MDATTFESTLREQGYEVSIRANQKSAWIFQAGPDRARICLWLNAGDDGSAFEDRPRYSVALEAPHGEEVWSEMGKSPADALEAVAEMRGLSTDYHYKTTHGFDDALVLADDEDLYIQISTGPMVSRAAYIPRSREHASDEAFLDNFDCNSPVRAASVIDGFRARNSAPTI